MAVEESVVRVAGRIKTWRSEAGFSLQELANRSGVSPSTIHKIEHGQTVPTIAVVLKLARGLGRHATELFDDEYPRRTSAVVREQERSTVVTPRGARIEALAGELEGTEIAVWRLVHPPGFGFGSETLSQLGGEIVLLVEHGELEARVGEERFALRTGDVLHFKASLPYCWDNVSEAAASALVVGNVSDALRPAMGAQMRRFAGLGDAEILEPGRAASEA